MSDRNQLRRRLQNELRTDADLNAFCSDFLPDVRKRFSDGMDRTQKETLILELAEPALIIGSLDQYKIGSPPSPSISSPRISIGRLPTSVANPVGRSAERQVLQQAWEGPARRHVVSVVALGGQGKTTLVVNWLVGLAAAGFPGAGRVFAWSFYSQGASDDRAASADEFVAAALTFFGDSDPTRGSPFDKADRLRDLLRRERSLLILDGLEPLQHPPGAPQGEGTLKDKPLASLLRDLALQSSGLTVITSRSKLADLAAFEGGTTETIDLGPLSESEGMQLLQSFCVRGSNEDLVAAVRDFAGHPLALTLLGSLLRDGYGGDVQKRSQVGSLSHDDEKGDPARRVMAAYDRWFKSDRERVVLRLLGLFDRPAPVAALQALRAAPAVPDLNEALVELSDGAWNQTISRLRRAGLVEPEKAQHAASVDAHPLVREYFGERLKQENEGAWQEGHARLYVWYAASTKDQPDTAEAMAPLYAAVYHGCRAGRHQEVLDEVYWRRIHRRNEHYSTQKLGAYGAELSALSGFFTTPWTQPVSTLREEARAFVLNSAGYALRAQGRLEEAMAPMRAGLDARRALQDRANAARAAGNLSELQLGLGQVREATAMARHAVELADRSGDGFMRLATRTILADAVHQAGQLQDAQRLFIEAEALQREDQPEQPFLYSLQGYQYCDLLLDQGASEQVLQRAERALEVAQQNNVLLSIGLHRLSLGRAHAARAAAGRRASAGPARDLLSQAVARLREAGDQLLLPLGLLYRAAWFRQTHDDASALRDLDEGLLLAQRGHMRLHECDFHLERARLLQGQKKSREAKEALRLARDLVDMTGYERRRAEVERLTRELAQPTSLRGSCPRWAFWVLIFLGLLVGVVVARAQPAAPYDALVAQARTAALQEHWAECARLYNRAIQTFPADQSRPQSELSDLRKNRDRCRQHTPAPPAPPEVALGKLSMNVPRLIGRHEELKQLEEAWDGPKRRQLVAVVAVGGQGKTTLVVNWLLRMRAQAFRGARRVFAWSFYSQGTSDDRAGSSDEFLAVALKFFGDREPDRGSPFEKAARLRDLLRKERTLLILDGLEPLQYAPGAPEGEGVLRDRAMGELLADLAASNPGLVVVTSRVKLGSLQAFEDGALKTLWLRPFSDGDGMALLKYLGVQGRDEELVATVREAHGHPLTLSLLGNLLHEAYGGDIRQRSAVVSLKPGSSQGIHAQHVMAAYDRWFKSESDRAVLRLLGLFDRPAPGSALQALRAAPAVAGLNDGLVEQSDGAWNQTLSRLRRAGLVEPENAQDTTSVDTHPLVREYFGEHLKQENEAAWKQGHARLYAWYAASTRYRPDTAEEMAPLYAAVYHGCRAGRHQEVFDEVYRRRIHRGNEHYSMRQLGAFGAELSALSGFFTTPWTQPVPSLREGDRAFLLNTAGSALRAQGRLEDAVAPMRAALEAYRAWQAWKHAPIAAANLSQLQLGLGQVREATAMARQAVELADRSGDVFQRLARRTDLADALYQAGHRGEAQRLYSEAEAMQREDYREYPLLTSVQGYQYCDVLLDQGASEQVLQRAEKTLRVARQNNWLLDIGLDQLSLGRAHAARSAAGQRASAGPARDQLNQAVARLREAGTQHHLPLGLLHRAAWFRQTRDDASALRDLDEGLLLAQRGHMRLHECDLHLERARLFHAQKKPREAKEALRLARDLVDKTGYERRRSEVERLTRELGER